MTTHSHMQNKEDGKRIIEIKGYTESLRIIDLEESQSKEGLKTDIADNAVSEDYAELLRELPDEMADLWYKLNLLMRKPGKAFVFIELINFDEDFHAGKRQCEVNLNQEVNSEEQIRLMKSEIRKPRNEEMVVNLWYETAELEMSFQEICGDTGMLEFEVRNDEVMNEKPEEEPGRRHLYIPEMYMEGYWHRDHDVLIQEHNQLQQNSIQHMGSEMDKELDEL